MSRLPGLSARMLLLAASAVLLSVGCGKSGPRADSSGMATKGAVPPEVVLTTVDRDAYDKLIDRRRGQVVLVDFWATWCVPCVEQFSHTVELARRHQNDGLTAVSVSMDDPADAETILAFLRSQDAGVVENLVSQDGGGPRSMTAFEIAGGALPHYKLYDRAGQLRYTFALDPASDQQFSLQDVDMAIERLLAE